MLTLACLVVVIFGLRYASGVLNPILVALFVVINNRLQRTGLTPRR